jgi:hypothetical protein
MGWIAPMREIQSGVKPPQFKKQGSEISREGAKARRRGGKWVREGAPA